jgi:ABC-2 type transport system ATP-binding protein
MSPPVLSVLDIHKSFSGVHAVRGLSFDVAPGEIFGFLGPNGAGKTTSLRMIMGITRPDRGAVRFEGGPVLDRTRIGYLPEERGLFEDATLMDTLVYLGTLRAMPRADARAEAKRWLERLEFTDRLTAKVGTLSKGNQQKVQFLGAILHRPVLAVLDEPFSGLDPLNQELFLSLIRELKQQGTAVLLSAHQLNLVERLCDRFLLIARGREVLAGTLETMRRDAAHGAGEVVRFDVRPGAAAMTDLSATLARLVPGGQWNTGAGTDGLARLEVALPTGTDLSPLLAELSARFRVERVTTSALSLHEIYVRAVGGADDAPDGVEPATPVDAREANHV